ncbi:uncharacterized protein LOC127751313 [Frankliniella occidentalis]|uniref:Uncharacterized protein LOC127751313 n=1 Tax=Frankliniella occidentalis TaxID=133901 RepID=A0A9C6X7F0_FRAOC|nr:uncharacterized protein LOC127751313 [Frankliniella occidentalis]
MYSSDRTEYANCSRFVQQMNFGQHAWARWGWALSGQQHVCENGVVSTQSEMRTPSKKNENGFKVEEDDDVSSITGSEMFALNPDFLSSQSKCQSWLEQQTLEATSYFAAPPSDPGLPQKEVVKKQPLVPYTPSASSTSTRCTRTREEEGRISSPSSRFARAVLRQGNLKQFYGLSKRLGYSNPPRQIALISEAEKENHVVPFPSISSGNSAKRKCLGNKTDLAEASIPSNLCDTPIPGPSTTQGKRSSIMLFYPLHF